MLETLTNPPEDVVTNVTFAEKSNLLAVSSWDKTLRLYNVDSSENGKLVHKCEWSAPVMDCIFLEDDKKVAFGDLNKNLNLLDIETGAVVTVGRHNAPVRTVRFNSQLKSLVSGGWDKRIKVFDLRSTNLKPTADVEIYGKAYCMDMINNTLVVGDSMKRVYIYDLSRGLSGFSTPDTKDGILKFQYRYLRCFPDEKGFALSSIEGRVAWEYFSKDPEVVSQQYAFKCHRNKTSSENDVAYAVNTIDFHPQYGTFVTGGADGLVCAWDGFSRKRLWKSVTFDTSVASVSFNSTGDKLAIAVSDVFQLNPSQSATTNICIREIKPDECKPRKFK
ncbi:hypothetical protein BEWA_024940 [Theileria equi strain WA]|uniref:Uncharacterized protein n=1 Tax=Theileria equi strain WA TaxID=1537102 RepID=L0AVR9_THEEQ|nr:hypothetical protein BEWA_024940 [Theileria equi strain WA]AFZ79645.1 hypothetical protein BEWA_024940 [Theileria equi strain WA]|eukprot:XP_004829311.1 hypothetical protein BEWA_024940 [Theileria equi strain WA]